MIKTLAALAAVLTAASVWATDDFQPTFWVDGTAVIQNWTDDPFPSVNQISPRYIQWGGLGVALDSELVWDDQGGPVTVNGDWEGAGFLTHNNRPIQDWWEPGNSSTTGDTAKFELDVDVTVYADAARTELVLDHDVFFEIDHWETRNSLPYPDGPGEIGEGHTFSTVVDDLFRAEVSDVDIPFNWDGQDYTLAVEAFHEGAPGAGLTTDFWSPEGGSNVGHIGVRITADAIPEPSISCLLLSAGVCLAGWRLFRRRKES